MLAFFDIDTVNNKKQEIQNEINGCISYIEVLVEELNKKGNWNIVEINIYLVGF